MVLDTWRTREQARPGPSAAAVEEAAIDAASPSASAGRPPGPTTWIAPEWLRPVTIALGALAVVFALGATVQVYRVGHSGAKAVWQSTDMNGPSTGGGEEGG